MITRIHVKNYRGIKELHIDDLKPINIFVGKNGAGKTSVLEALSLAARPVLHQHFRFARFRGLRAPEFDEADTLDTIFNLRDHGRASHLNFRYNEYDSSNSLADINYSIEILPLYSADIEERKIKTLSEQREQYYVNSVSSSKVVGLEQRFVSDTGVDIKQRLLPSSDGYEISGDPDLPEILGSFFIEARRSMSIGETAKLLGEKFRTVQWKESFLSQLQAILPDIKDIQVLNNGIYADIGTGQLLPIPMVGDGFNRIFLILVGIMASRAKTVMVDEIDSGLHHSVMNEFWESIAKMAGQDIQLFCTTHNEEMLDSLLDAFGSDSELFQIYRIDRDNEGETSCVIYSPERFDRALQFGLDVR